MSTLVASGGCRSRPCTSTRMNAGASSFFRSQLKWSVMDVVVVKITLCNKVACVKLGNGTTAYTRIDRQGLFLVCDC